MLTRFEIHNFKSIKSLDLPMRPFMVLVGPNGAGKTNIVGAVELLGDLLNRGNTDPARELGWDQIIRRGQKPARAGMFFAAEVALPHEVVERSMRIGPPSGNSRTRGPKSVVVRAELAIAGKVGEEEISATREVLELKSPDGRLRIEASPQGVQFDLGNDQSLWQFATSGAFFKFDRDEGKDLGELTLARLGLIFSERSLAAETERRILRILSLQRAYSPWLSYFLQTIQVRRLRLDTSSLRTDSVLRDSLKILGPSGENLAAAVDRLKGHEKEPSEAFLDLLRALQQVYPRIEDVRPRRVGSARLTLLVKELGISGLLAQSSISDGVLHALALLVALESPGPGMLAIEEPENAIHPWSVAEIVRLAQEGAARRQTMLTTHSPVVVDAVADPNSLYIVEQVGSAGTTAQPARAVETSIDAILRESGQKLGAVWIDGSLGGVPVETGS